MALSTKSILGGPLLRRSETGRVCVWIATDTDVTITGEIFGADTALDGTYLQLGRGETSSLQFGSGLFVTLVEIKPLARKGVPQSQTFPAGRLLAYDLVIRARDKAYAAGKRLPQFFSPIDDAQNGIAYPGLPLPTFYLSAGSGINFLHGSCRKLRGEQGDALVFADQLMGANLGISLKDGSVSQLDKRPSALILTGDQIYADDVAEPLVDILLQHGPALIGFDEKMPRGAKGGPRSRSAIVCGQAGEALSGAFTSTAMRNHLLSFADFVVLYLLGLNPALWPQQWPNSSPCPGYKDADWRGDVFNLDRAKQAVPLVRRALANVPTYMIFDDHEVTDDWNLHQRWQTQVAKNPLATRVVANALAAYWLFQAWGNDPDNMKDLADPIAKSLKDAQRGGGTFESTLLDHDSWAYVAPTVPPVVLIDSRTQRAFDPDPDAKPGDSTKPPRLIDADEARNVTRLANQAVAASPDRMLILVAATPVFGIEAFEKFQKILSAVKSPEEFDLEAWRANPSGYVDLIDVIAAVQPRSCVILSGDVHYSFASRFALRAGGQQGWIAGLQFTSSAIKNAIIAGKRTALQIAQWTNFPYQRVDIWKQPVHSATLGSRTPLGGGSSESDAATLKILGTAPVIVDSGFTRRVAIVEPQDFQLVIELEQDSGGQGPMIRFDCGLGQLVYDGQTLQAIFHAADRVGSVKDAPRVIAVNLNAPPPSPPSPSGASSSFPF